MTIAEAGIVDESSIDALLVLDGGKRKRKKKVYTKPKRIPHKHKKRPKAVLEYYSVEPSGKIKKLKSESPVCKAGTYMADHPDRLVCGKSGYTLFKLTADGNRMPIPKQNKPSSAAPAAEAKKAAPAKGKKKK
mmetsp:Transcript_13770/g.9749  ORF Transcript_13770/g.9749 Transcript_13770/m.9749 type:complete len:133 (-) Transcript_13770:176-574(-)|eukprot:CAMPEP_0116872728 /NCGR_PEP_ID=MMETSP0463-20121206/3560_1 /TAXON_ID=181622 /ORGANISM="Strombidinopsis sp, Strain SopsisLIS2011" /LENGTH=132 /DNA_ID=CAMNT_0004513403 /DNA_START=265 /DNA_END=663 /DNA_ORIENTATION=-